MVKKLWRQFFYCYSIEQEISDHSITCSVRGGDSLDPQNLDIGLVMEWLASYTGDSKLRPRRRMEAVARNLERAVATQSRYNEERLKVGHMPGVQNPGFAELLTELGRDFSLIFECEPVGVTSLRDRGKIVALFDAMPSDKVFVLLLDGWIELGNDSDSDSGSDEPSEPSPPTYRRCMRFATLVIADDDKVSLFHSDFGEILPMRGMLPLILSMLQASDETHRVETVEVFSATRTH